MRVEADPTIWTVGHSTHSADAFVALLRQHPIALLADVRRFPRSRRHPQFDQEILHARLQAEGIEYIHFPALGGRRKPRPDSRNDGWRDAGFRGYADYMETETFRDGLAQLIDAAATQRTAIMCAEALWRGCHRGLIADALKIRGLEVVHIVDAQRTEPHPYTSAARVIDGALSYAATVAVQGNLDF